MVKIKIVIILCIICLIIGAGGTGFAIYKFTSVDHNQLDAANARITILDKQITEEQQNFKDTIAGINKQHDIDDEYIRKLQSVISNIKTINIDTGNTIDENDRLLSRLAIINKNVAEGLNKVRNTK